MQDTQETSLSTVSKPIHCSCCSECHSSRFIHSHLAACSRLERTNTVLECTMAVNDSCSFESKSLSFVCSTSSSFNYGRQHGRRYYFGTLPVKRTDTFGRDEKRPPTTTDFWRRILCWRKTEASNPTNCDTLYSNPDYCHGATFKL